MQNPQTNNRIRTKYILTNIIAQRVFVCLYEHYRVKTRNIMTRNALYCGIYNVKYTIYCIYCNICASCRLSSHNQLKCSIKKKVDTKNINYC